MGNQEPTWLGGSGLSRRDFVKACGAAGLGTAAIGTASGDTGDDPWIAQHENWAKGVYSDVGQDHSDVFFKSLHRLHYLGANWAPYTSPGDSDGSWQHTFLITGLGMSVGWDVNQDFERTDFGPSPKVTGSTVGVEVPEDGNLEQIAVAPRRDDDLYSFINPDYLEARLERNTGTAGEEEAWNALSQSISGSWGTNRTLEPGTVEDWQEIFVEDREETENERAITMTFLTTAISRITKGAADTLLDAIDVTDLTLSLSDLQVDPRRVDEGFEQQVRNVTGDTPASRCGSGHTLMFDVYVPPGEYGVVKVTNAVDVDDSSGGWEREDPWEEQPVWGVELHRLDAPDSTPDPFDNTLSFGASVQDQEYHTNVPKHVVGPDTSSPTAAFEFGNGELGVEELTVDETFSVDASDSQTAETGLDIEAYEWSVFPVDPDVAEAEQAPTGPPVDAGLNTDELDEQAEGTMAVEPAGVEREYAVGLTVRDEAGRTDSTQQSVTVPAALPEPHLTLEPSDPEFGEQVTFDTSESIVEDDDPAYRWTVTFDENATDPPAGAGLSAVRDPGWDLRGEQPQQEVGEVPVSYERVYDITLEIENDAGTAGSVTERLTVGAADNVVPTAVLDVDEEIYDSDTVWFDGSDSADPNPASGSLTYEWFVESGAEPGAPDYDPGGAVATGEQGS